MQYFLINIIGEMCFFMNYKLILFYLNSVFQISNNQMIKFSQFLSYFSFFLNIISFSIQSFIKKHSTV